MVGIHVLFETLHKSTSFLYTSYGTLLDNFLLTVLFILGFALSHFHITNLLILIFNLPLDHQSTESDVVLERTYSAALISNHGFRQSLL